MNFSMTAFLIAAGAVTLAEMGDKTQLLAMAFATRYKSTKVLLGVFVATVLNHAGAVAVGYYLGEIKSAQAWIQGIASLSFIFFGLWTIRGDKLEGEENRKTRFGGTVTVAIAFFIAELGDKTQLATIALAAKFPESPLGVLMGTTAGMLVADGIGILVGVVMCKRIPEKVIKLASAAVFIFFGLIGVYEVARVSLGLNVTASVLIVAVLVLITGAVSYRLIKNNREDQNKVVEEYCKIRNNEPSTDN